MSATFAVSTQRRLAWANYGYQLLVLLVIAGILTAAMVLQYAQGELPCPLCLIERVAMFGVCFGILLDVRRGYSYQHAGFSLLSAILLLVVSVRQTLLDIYPRPGHEYIGSAVFGIHLPVWSIIIALTILLAFALKMAIVGGDEFLESAPLHAFPALRRIADAAGVFVIVLCVVNLVSVVVQCGLGECHTTGYRLLQ